jgi:hypothetical protein
LPKVRAAQARKFGKVENTLNWLSCYDL